jgi:CelD/BcsL family acetyltransferase involved in cellulose biosynthesis
VNVDVVAPGELGAGEQETWRAFQDAEPSLASPFLSYEFTLAASRYRPRTRVAVVREGGETVAFLPMELGRFGEATPVAALINDAQGMVHRGGYDWDPREVLALSGIGVWEFDHVVAQKPFEQYTTLRARSPIMDLGSGFDSYLAGARRRSSRIKDLPRRQRRLEREIGPVRFDFHSDDVEAMSTLFRWKSEQYRRTARTDRFALGWIRSLVTDLAAMKPPRCSGQVSLLWAGDDLVAGHVGLRAPSVLPTWFPTYDTRFSKYSPGLLLHVAMAEAAAAAGVGYIDLGRGEKDYKDWLADDALEVWEGRVTTRRSAAALHWGRRVPVRTLRNVVVGNRTLYEAADRALKGYGAVRTRLGAATRAR